MQVASQFSLATISFIDFFEFSSFWHSADRTKLDRFVVESQTRTPRDEIMLTTQLWHVCTAHQELFSSSSDWTQSNSGWVSE